MKCAMLRSFGFVVVALCCPQYDATPAFADEVATCADEVAPRVAKVGATLGAVVEGIDLRDLSAGQLGAIRAAFAEHVVLVFRNQTLTPEQQIAFAAQFADPVRPDGLPAVEPHPLGSRRKQHPVGIPREVMVVKNTLKSLNSTARNDVWHTDLSCMARPVGASVLYAVQVTPGYGDTMFASGYHALESLSVGMQRMVAGLKGVHNSKVFEVPGYKEAFESFAPDVAHPLARTHPVTGRKSLYIADNFMERFEDMTVEESAPLKEYLLRWASRPENVYRHRWRQHDVVMWDNRCALHYGIFDYGPEHPREMHRTTAAGEVPY